MSDFTKYKDRDIIYIVDTFLRNNEEECKRLLGIFLDTKNQSTIDRYYDEFEKLQERGYFDPDEKGLGLTWHWGAFFSGFLFYWYRKQYGMMPIIFILMFLWFFPSMIASAACAYASVLDSFCMTIVKGMEHKDVRKFLKRLSDGDISDDFKNKIMDKMTNVEDMNEAEAAAELVFEASTPYIEAELKKRGGTDNKVIGLLVLVILIIVGFIISNG